MKVFMKKMLFVLLCSFIICGYSSLIAPEANAAKLLWPVPGHKSWSRSYISGVHNGLDITDGSITGATVIAAASGYVTRKETCTGNELADYLKTKKFHTCGGLGTGIIIKGDDGRYYQYAHMQGGSIPSNIYVGAYVKAGTKVGCVGNTGTSDGAHLHFQISVGGPFADSRIDPLNESYIYSNVLPWYETVVQSDPGTNFYAYIIKNSTWKAIGHVNNNVELTGNTGNAHEVWYFVRQSDKSYVIYNCDNNKVLTVKDSGTANDTNIIIEDYKGTDNQKWYFHGRWSGEYILRSKHSNKVLDVKTDHDTVGTNIHLWEYHGGTAQVLAVYKCNAISVPELKIETSTNKVKFSWPNTQGAGSHSVKIYKNSTATGTPYLTKNVVGNSCEVELGSGTYSAVLHAQNAHASSKSSVKTFTVQGSSTSDTDTWTYANSLPVGVTSKNYTIQYRPTYETVAKTSPGSDWIKGTVAKQVYENSGSVYTSKFPLTTSDTRVLTGYSYYHYCSGSKGTEVNYEYTSTFPHYDGINRDNVVEFYSHADYADSRYTFYGLKYKDTGNYVYCNSSGVGCNGSDGTHGNRSYYWYKVYYYQDKVAVNHYKYTKQGNWSNAKDSSAVSHTVRYKPISKTSTAKKPGATSKISASQTTKTISLSWNKVSGATSYCVYQLSGNEWKILSTVTGTSYKVSGLKSGRKYTFAVKACQTVNDSTAWSDSYKTITVATKPAAPKSIKTKQTTTTITLSWKKVTGADGYRVYKYNTKKKKYEKLKDVTGTSLRITDLKAGTVYKYKVRAYIKDDGKIWGSYSDVFETATKCKTPKITKLTTSKGKATFTWSNVSGESGYQVYYSTKKDSGFKKLKSYKTNVVKGSKTKLKSGKKYYFKVRAYKKTDSGTVYSSWSSVKSVKIK